MSRNFIEFCQEVGRHWDDILDLVIQVVEAVTREPPPPPRPLQPLGGVFLPPRPVTPLQQLVSETLVNSVIADGVLSGLGAVALAFRLQATARAQPWAVASPILACLAILILHRPAVQPPAVAPSRTSTVRGENDRIVYSASSMQGFGHMNAYATILDLDGNGSTSFFGVYDGHGGANVSLYCANQFHTELLKDEEYHNNLDHAVGRVFFRMDEKLREDNEWRLLDNPPPGVKVTPYPEGSTACVALIRGNRIIVASVGDSRCVLSKIDGQAMDLSTDHRPNLPEERERIENAGGQLTTFSSGDETRFLLRCSQTYGILAISRSIGDFHFKSHSNLSATEKMVTCNPEVRIEEIADDTEFLLIATNGIWNILSSQGAVDLVRQKLSTGTRNLGAICENLLNCCVKSGDNATVILVQFKHSAGPPPPLLASGTDVPGVHHTGAGPSSFPDPEYKADNDSEVKKDEAEDSLMPASVNNGY